MASASLLLISAGGGESCSKPMPSGAFGRGMAPAQIAGAVADRRKLTAEVVPQL